MSLKYEPSEEPQVKLADFGLAAMLGNGSTQDVLPHVLALSLSSPSSVPQVPALSHVLPQVSALSLNTVSGVDGWVACVTDG